MKRHFACRFYCRNKCNRGEKCHYFHISKSESKSKAFKSNPEFFDECVKKYDERNNVTTINKPKACFAIKSSFIVPFCFYEKFQKNEEIEPINGRSPKIWGIKILLGFEANKYWEGKNNWRSFGGKRDILNVKGEVEDKDCIDTCCREFEEETYSFKTRKELFDEYFGSSNEKRGKKNLVHSFPFNFYNSEYRGQYFLIEFDYFDLSELVKCFDENSNSKNQKYESEKVDFCWVDWEEYKTSRTLKGVLGKESQIIINEEEEEEEKKKKEGKNEKKNKVDQKKQQQVMRTEKEILIEGLNEEIERILSEKEEKTKKEEEKEEEKEDVVEEQRKRREEEEEKVEVEEEEEEEIIIEKGKSIISIVEDEPRKKNLKVTPKVRN